MHGKTRKKYRVYFIACAVLYVAGVTAYSVWNAAHYKHEIFSDIDKQLLMAARSLKYMLAPDFHDRAVDEDSIGMEEELKNRKAVSDLAEETDFTYLYTLAEKDGSFYFSAPTVTEEEARERESWYFLPYDDIPADFVRAFKEKQIVYSTYTDQWGHFRSIALPQKSPGGRDYLACADYDISYVNALIYRSHLISTLTGLCFLLLTAPLYLALRSAYYTYTQRLNAANKELTAHQLYLEDLVASRTSDLQAAKDAAVQANNQKSQFLANVSHEIRTPLNGIIGFSEMIMRSPSLESAQKQAGTILDVSEHLLKLINDLLDNSKLLAGQLELENRQLYLYGLVDQVAKNGRVQAEKKGVHFFESIGENVPELIVGDEFRLRQILLNLINNAVKFTHEGSVSLLVETGRFGDEQPTLIFSVVDTGIGIDNDKQEMIFDRFVQADLGLAREYGGTGLGTSISKNLVELMGGVIGVESDPKQGGSRFWFEIPMEISETPVERVKDDAVMEAVLEKSEAAGGDILLVDDYAVNVMVAESILKSAGHAVHIARDGQEALDACSAGRFDLILMDLQMPNMDGIEATSRIRYGRSINANVPILGLTASADQETARKCLDAGMNGVITKPVRQVKLLARVNQWIKPGHETVTQGLMPDGEVIQGEPAEGAPLNMEDALDDLGGDRELLASVLDEFLKRLGLQIPVIRKALESGDIETIKRESHAVKGGAGSIYAHELYDIAREMNEIKQPINQKRISELLALMEKEYEALKKYTAESLPV